MASLNIAFLLSGVAAERPDHPAVVVAKGSHEVLQYTYQQLDAASTAVAQGLRNEGVTKGTRVVLMVLPGLDFFAVVFALFKLGAVLVGIDPGMGLKNLGICLQEAAPEVFIGNRKAHLARRVLRWASKTLNLKITTENIPFQGNILSLNQIQSNGKASGGQLTYDTGDEDTAAILFTSGSTGVPKGVVYSHANFNAQVTSIQKTFAIRPGEKDLATFPLFALFAPVMGMTAVIPDMDFTRPGSVDPEMITDTITTHAATTMFGSPALLDRVGRWGADNKIKLPGLKRVISAGAPVSPAVLDRFSRLLGPGGMIHTPYGATESLPVSTISSEEVLSDTINQTNRGKGVCVGRAVEGMEIKIIRITDDPVPEMRDELLLGPYETGEIVVCGPQVTRSYYNREESTRLAKIYCPGGSFYHRMGDLGYFDDKGRLWFCGRKSQRVVTPGGTLFTISCEAVFNAHPDVFRSALVAVSKNGTIIPVLCVEPEHGKKKIDHKILRSELFDIGSRYDHTSNIKEILFHRGFPVDIRHNAKIGRERLSAWAEKKLK